MTAPRILFVSPVADFKGGAEVVMRHMLANPHIEPVLAVPEDGPVAEAARAEGVPVCYYHPTAMLNVHRPPRPGPMLAALADAVRCAFRLRRLARAHRCSIIHSNGLKPHMLCAILGLLTRTRTLVHLHDIPYRASERGIWRLIAGCVSRVVIVSRPCFPANTLPSHVTVIHNGIRMLAETLPRATASRTLRLGFVGRFHPNKGMDVLLDWLLSIRAHGVDATLAIRGRPDADLPEYWAAIQDRILREGLSPYVRYEGWVTGAATYAGLDMLLMTSKTPDPLPLVVPEAMSAGVVVAGYAAGGVPEMIDDGQTGLLATDPDDLGRRVAELWADQARFAELRSAAHAHVQDHFTMERFHRHLLHVYRTMLGTAANRAGPLVVPATANCAERTSEVPGHGGGGAQTVPEQEHATLSL